MKHFFHRKKKMQIWTFNITVPFEQFSLNSHQNWSFYNAQDPVTLRQRPQRPYCILKTGKMQGEQDKMLEKITIFQFVLRPYYAPGRMLLCLTHPSYVLLCAWSCTHHVLCVFNMFFLRPFRSHYAVTMRLPCSHRAQDLINSSLCCPLFIRSASFLDWTMHPKGR